MAYRYDTDLEFLGKLESKDMDDLVYCLTVDKDGLTRISEELTASEMYRKHKPDHKHYWDLIAAEIQTFGANSFATMFRGGKGVPYKEVLCDVCDKLKVNYNKDSSVETIELNLLMKILKDALDKMSPEELKELAESLGVGNVQLITRDSLIGIFQAVFRAGGFKSFQLTLIIVNSIVKALIGRGLSLAQNALLTKAMSILTGPIGWAATALLTAIDIAGAAYRVTIPAVILVAALRQKHLYAGLAEEVKLS